MTFIKRGFYIIGFILIIVLSGCVEKNTTYNISFDTNGGTIIQEKNEDYNSSLTLPNPEKEGHTFDGWYEDEGLTHQFISTKMPSKDISLYAKWVVNEYSIEFYTSGGHEIDPLTFSYGESIQLPNPTKENSVFKGWYQDENLTQLFNLKTMPAHNIILYVKWEEYYTLNFNTSGGNVIESQTYAPGDILSLPIPTKSGYIFGGWYEDSSFTDAFNLTTMPNSNKTLYAKWNTNQYTLIFNTNGGKTLNHKELSHNAYIELPIPTRDGFIFGGWYEDSLLSKRFSYMYMPNHNVNVYAKWTNEYVRFPMAYLNVYVIGNAWQSVSFSGEDSGKDQVLAPFTGVVKRIDEENNVWFQSLEKVKYADGTLDYMTIHLGNAEDISYLTEGKLINQGELLYSEGTSNNNNYVFLEVGKGTCLYNAYNECAITNRIEAYNAFYIDPSVTTMINSGNKNWEYLSESPIFPMQYLRVTQGMNNAYSHAGTKAIDLGGKDTGMDVVYAPFTGVIKRIASSSGNFIWIESLNKVKYANGTLDYMTILIGHCNNISHLKVGQIIQQGELFYKEGTATCSTCTRITGNHIHLEVGKGKYQENGWYRNSQDELTIYNAVNPYDALFVDKSFTTVITNPEYNYPWKDL